jgi:lysophospholipase L1-like esterase
MLRLVTIVGLVAVLLFGAAYVRRTQWINAKIATLTSPASIAYAPANAALPPKGPRPRIVLIGDSRIAQWPAELFSPQWEIVNRGIGGETTAQTIGRFQADALALDADVIVIETGVNDLFAASFMDEGPRQIIASAAIERIQALANAAAASGRRALIATILPPASPDILRRFVWNESLRDLVADANSELRKAKLPGRVKVIDLASVVVADDPKTLFPVYRKDVLHLNIAGYERLTFALQSEIQSSLDVH